VLNTGIGLAQALGSHRHWAHTGIGSFNYVCHIINQLINFENSILEQTKDSRILFQNIFHFPPQVVSLSEKYFLKILEFKNNFNLCQNHPGSLSYPSFLPSLSLEILERTPDKAPCSEWIKPFVFRCPL
jgi:hypothetical protein